MKESKIEKTICKYAITLGWAVYKFVSPGLRGVPDRIFLRNGQIIFIEFKADNKKPRKQQIKRIKELKALGFIVEYIDSIEKGINLFNLLEG